MFLHKYYTLFVCQQQKPICMSYYIVWRHWADYLDFRFCQRKKMKMIYVAHNVYSAFRLSFKYEILTDKHEPKWEQHKQYYCQERIIEFGGKYFGQKFFC